MKKSPQAPKGKWRYGCVKRISKMKVGSARPVQTTFYELVEVYDQGRSYSADPVSLYSDKNKDDLIKHLEKVIADLKKYDLIVDKKPRITVIGTTP